MLFSEFLPIKLVDNKVLLSVKITPKASTNKIGTIFNNSLKIYVTAAAEAGQANKAVIELLSERLKISKSNINIAQGLTSPNKVIAINGDVENIVNSLKIIIS